MAMLTHNQIWTAIDRLAARAKLSPSGLAKKAGLDPTTFNKSKRVTPEGRQRWPSTESVAKALAGQAAAEKLINGVQLDPIAKFYWKGDKLDLLKKLGVAHKSKNEKKDAIAKLKQLM